MSKKIRIFLAIISGVLTALAFPPMDLSPFAWFGFVPLLFALRDTSGRQAFSTGMISGFTFFMATVYWVSHSMYMYGNLPAPATLSVLVLLCFYLAVYHGAFGFLYFYLVKKLKIPSSVLAPFIWVSLEFLRSHALSGFPWALTGYSQTGFLQIIQIADITGVYGISFLVVSVNGLVYDILNYQMNGLQKWHNELAKVFTGTFITLLLVCVSLYYGITKMNLSPSGDEIKVSIVQGNIPQDQKWDMKFRNSVMNKYMTMTKRVAGEGPDLIVWPESAIPFTFGSNWDFTQDLLDFQKGIDSYLLVGGVISKDRTNTQKKVANSAILLSPDGSVVATYDKIHLVPFGEYVPLKRFLPFIEKMVTAVGDFMAGNEYVVMHTPFAEIGTVICYEIIFPHLVRQFVRNGANMLVTITNDAWFGRTSAPYQHFSMAVFRAIENRTPVVRAANTGISGYIDERGRIIDESDIFVDTVMTQEIVTGRGNSIYARYGDIFAYFCIVVLSVMIIVAIIRR